MIFFKSVKFRLTLWYACILAVVLLSFTFFLYSQFERTLYKNVDQQIESEISSILESVLPSAETLMSRRSMSDTLPQVISKEPANEKFVSGIQKALNAWEKKTGRFRRSTYMIRMITFDQQVLTENLTGWQNDIIFPDYERDSAFMEKGSSYQTIYFEKKPIRLYYRLVRLEARPAFLVQAAKPIFEMEAFLRQLFLIIVLTIPVAVLIACVAGWILVKRAFASVDAMTQNAKKITAAYMRDRLPRSKSGDEIDRLAETLNEMMDRIEDSTRAVQDLSNNVSHELKTPLAIIRGEIDLALRKTRSPESLQETLKVIEGEVNELIRLVDDLMLLVKSDAKQLKFDYQKVNVEQVLQQVVDLFQERARQKDIHLKFISQKPLIVEGDALYLKRLFSNLIDNALKFTDEGGNVMVELQQDHYRVKVKVVDDGVGVSSDMHEKVFARFYRTDQARSQEGAGLGLNIAAAICDGHRGSLRFDSSPGRGTTVIVDLPQS